MGPAVIHSGWMRLWGVAIVAHIVGNPRYGQLVGDPTLLGVATAVTLVAAVGVIVVSDRRWLQVVALVGVVVVAWLEAPFLGNHWQLAALVSVGLLVAMVRGDGWEWFAPVGRWMLLGFYVWAAFAKLNTAFLDPAVSCGLEYANHSLASWGLPTIDSRSGLAWVPVLGAAAVELSVPVLLVLRRTRMFGVLVAVGFHGLVSLDLDQHFYDFTSVLIPLFLLWVPVETLDAITGRMRREFVRPLALFAGLVGLVGLLPLGQVTFDVNRIGGFVVWVPYLVWVVWALVRARGASGEAVGMRVRSVAGVALVGVVVAIGTMPYLEVRTATSWNMYANLVTADGESNHLLVRGTLPLTDHQSRIVTVLETSDPGLEEYVGSGYGLVERQFLHYLAEHPAVEVRYEVAGEERTVRGSEAGERLGVVIEKLQLYRAVDLGSTARCQTSWLPAR